MTFAELSQLVATLVSIYFAARSGGAWYEASLVEMPAKAALPADVPGQNRVILMGEDYAVTLARLNEGLSRLDKAMLEINRSADFNKRAARYAVWAAFWIAVSVVLPLFFRIMA